MKRKLIEWTVLGILVTGLVFFVRWFTPWAVSRYEQARGRLTVLKPRLDPALRQRLREEEVRLARGAPAAVPDRYETLPCLVLNVQEGIGVAPRRGVSARPGSVPSHPANPFRRCLDLVPGGPPVNALELSLKTGSVIFVQTDLYLPGDPPIAFTRVVQSFSRWNSRNQIYLPNEYLAYPTGHRNPYTDQTLWLADRSSVQFNRISKGTGYADAVYQHTATRGLFYDALAGWNGEGWDYDLPDGRTLVFPDSYYARRAQQGSMIGLIEPSGASLKLVRDPQGNLHEVRSSDGRWMKLHYQGPLVVSIEDSAGEKATYSYNRQDRLAASTNAAGETLAYGYNSSGGLTKVENEKARRRVVSVEYNSRGPASLQADGGAVYRSTVELVVNDGRGHHWVMKCDKYSDNGCQYEVHQK